MRIASNTIAFVAVALEHTAAARHPLRTRALRIFDTIRTLRLRIAVRVARFRTLSQQELRFLDVGSKMQPVRPLACLLVFLYNQTWAALPYI